MSEAADTVKSTVQDEAAKIGDKAREFASETGRKLQDKLQEQRTSGADYLLNVAGLVHRHRQLTCLIRKHRKPRNTFTKPPSRLAQWLKQ